MTLEEYKKMLSAKLQTIYDADEAKNITAWVFEYILKLSPVQQYIRKSQLLTDTEITIADNIADRLMHHEPIQYIVGEVQFMGLILKVSPTTLIPRPETEELTDWIINEYKNRKNLTILDIGSGSGCIAIALAKYLPNAKVSAIDIDSKAIAIAKENAANNEVAVNFSVVDFLQTTIAQRFDIVVSNPPYIGWEEKKLMRENVLQYEPEKALFVDDPLVFYKKIATDFSADINLGSTIYLELNEHYANATAALFSPFYCEIKKDIFGKERMLRVSKK